MRVSSPQVLLACALVSSSCTFAVRALELASGGGGADGSVSLDDGGVSLDDGGAPEDAAFDAAFADRLPSVDLSTPFCVGSPALAACYRFEDSAHPTQIRDDSSYGNHATASNVLFAAGIRGNAAAVGSASSIRAPDSVSLDAKSALTLELWVRPESLPAAGGRYGLVDDDGQYGLFIGAGGDLRCSVNATTLSSAAGEIDVGAWSYVACTYDGATLRLYHDGRLLTSMPETGGVSMGNANGLAIAGNSPTGDELLGLIDDLRIWLIARTAKEICDEWGGGDC
jgi:hypothetical protein